MRLGDLALKDAEGMLSWMHDPASADIFQCDFNSFTEDDVKNFILNSKNDENNVHYACVDDSDNYLGTVSLKHIDKHANNAEYAVSFCKAAQGTGAAKFATEEILKIAFNELNLERVYLNVISVNERANAFYKKMGFIYEGTFKKHILINGKLRDLNWYRILKEEFN